jgi:hypothetical protein
MEDKSTTSFAVRTVRAYIAENGTTPELDQLLEGLEQRNALMVHLIPQAIWDALMPSNCGPISQATVDRLNKVTPDGLEGHSWKDLAERGRNYFEPYGKACS